MLEYEPSVYELVDVYIKTGGILAMFGSIMVLILIPFVNTSNVRNTTFRPIFKVCFWVFVADFIVLT